MGYGAKMGALAIAVWLGAGLVPGCVIRIGQGSSGDSAGSGQGATGGADVGGNGGSGGSGGGSGSGGGAEAFAGIDPQVLGRESLKADALSYDVYGLVASSADPNTVDQATIDGLVQQFAPMAEVTINNWLATVDPSTIQAGTNPKWECTEQYNCPYAAKCSNAPYNGIKNLNCWVTNCGSSKCSICPDWFPDWIKSLALKSWCAYVCEAGSPPKVLAVGAGGVTIFGNPYPEAGPYCIDP